MLVCTEMLWMCVLYVSFGSKVRPRTFGCVAMYVCMYFLVALVPVSVDVMVISSA